MMMMMTTTTMLIMMMMFMMMMTTMMMMMKMMMTITISYIISINLYMFIKDKGLLRILHSFSMPQPIT